MLVKKKGFREPSQVFARFVTQCPICKLPIEPGTSALNCGIEPPPGDKNYWWAHPACAARLYPTTPQPVPNDPRRVWLYVDLEWFLKTEQPRVAQAAAAENADASAGGSECAPF
jgi:hypothetical protein